MNRPGDIVEVEWVDSTGQGGWHAPEEAREMLTKMDCRSAGYLIHDEPAGIVITMGVNALGQYLESMAVPRAAITKMRRVGADDQ